MAPALIQEVDEDDTGPPTTLDLTQRESTLKNLLLDVAKFAAEVPHKGDASAVSLPSDLARQDIVLRFTGGWVRDKLLGVQSHDVDVAINKMTGEQFGMRLKEYLEIPGNPEKYGLEGVAVNDNQNQDASSSKSKLVGGLHKIEANPEKSKHLETITTKVLGLDIDLVNLRKETYTDDSRNPQIEFGTPEEDALRRDATVNALFYNLSTGQVEDFTRKGHEDMRHKIIRTPLEPYQTFKDDPLRVLRLIRFASRLGYTIDSSTLNAMKDDDIRTALRRKISRERVGVELEKALRGPDPHEAVRLIFDLKLYFTAFSDPTVSEPEHYVPDESNWSTIIDCLEDTITNDADIARIAIRDDEERYMAWQLATLIPYRDAPQPETVPGKKPPPPIAATVAREGIKATNKVCDLITCSLRNQVEISSFVDQLDLRKRRPEKSPGGEDPSARDVLGMAIRRWGTTWRSQVVYSFLVDLADHLPTDQDAASSAEKKYGAFLRHAESLGILDACAIKPLLDGKTLANALDTRPGPWMKDALDVVVAWQLRNPEITDAQLAVEEVRQRRGELSSALVRHFLKLTIRPQFSKTKPTAVTDTGRKNATTVLPPKITSEIMDEEVLKPWKSEKDLPTLRILEWTIGSLNANLAEEMWPLVIPPLLTLLDDWQPEYKCLGAKLLQKLLTITPTTLLHRTGLGEVFEQALLPCLTYLPSLTLEQDSVKLLDSVYPALLTLSRKRYPTLNATSGHPASPFSSHTNDHARIKFLDSILRKGILYGHTHCSDYPRLTNLFLVHLMPIISDLGLDSVKHLKYTLPMINEVLSTRSLAVDIENHHVLLTAIQALQTIIRNAWPRMIEHRGEVTKGLMMAWLNVDDHARHTPALNTSRSKLIDEMRITVTLLRAALGDGWAQRFGEECESLMIADARLKVLFKSTD